MRHDLHRHVYQPLAEYEADMILRLQALRPKKSLQRRMCSGVAGRFREDILCEGFY